MGDLLAVGTFVRKYSALFLEIASARQFSIPPTYLQESENPK